MRGLLPLLILALGLPAGAFANGLQKLADRDDLLGWEAVGRLDINGRGYCTATLIESDLVLTAAHCVFDRATGRPFGPEQFLFRAGLQNGTAIADRKVSQIAVMPRYNPRVGMTHENVRHDVALLRLDQPVSTTDADPFVLHAGPVSGVDISVTSYGQGRSDAPSRQRQCQIVGQNAYLIAFDCNVTFGSSGAPVFVQVGNRSRILSIVSGGSAAKDRSLGLGMHLPTAVSALKADLRRTKPPAKAGDIRRIQVGGRSQTGAKFVRP